MVTAKIPLSYAAVSQNKHYFNNSASVISSHELLCVMLLFCNVSKRLYPVKYRGSCWLGWLLFIEIPSQVVRLSIEVLYLESWISAASLDHFSCFPLSVVFPTVSDNKMVFFPIMSVLMSLAVPMCVSSITVGWLLFSSVATSCDSVAGLPELILPWWQQQNSILTTGLNTAL